jgi:fructose-1,6-bisphosphatase III
MAAAEHYSPQELRLLQLLSKHYPTISAAHTEMINLNAILALPKGTDHYVSDIHGAYEQFDHILRHASGAIQRKIEQTFGDQMDAARKVDLALLIYYPEQKLRHSQPAQAERDAWLAQTIGDLVRVARTAGDKYTRSKVRKRLDPSLAYILEELLTEGESRDFEREPYYHAIIRSVVTIGEGERLITTLAYLIQNLVVDRLFVLGDIFDRGPAAEKVMDRLMHYHDVVIQWGNHDIAWMAAAAGSEALIATVVRLALRYGNIETLHDGYGIHLRALELFANATYGDDPCAQFLPKAERFEENYDRDTVARMHKAITIMQFKLEAQIIRRHPEYGMDDRTLLDCVDLARGTVLLAGTSYPLLDSNFPTLGTGDRAALTPAEQQVIDALREQFTQSAHLQRHIRYLYSYGNMCRVQDGNLHLHGCLPVDEAGEFVAVPLGDEALAGPALLQRFEQLARAAYASADMALRQAGLDAMWYLWTGPQSPLYGRSRMTTFERYFIADAATHAEPKGPYYDLRDDEAFCRKVLQAFGADPEHGHIINGHVPVKVRKGERPIFAGGKLLVIDGGMSEAYQKETGIAGYTLISSSHETWLAAHDVYSSTEQMLADGLDVTPHAERVERFGRRKMLADTDVGRTLQGQLEDLHKLVAAYRSGVLVER